MKGGHAVKKVFYLSCSALWMLLLMVQHYRGQSFLLEDLVLVVSIMVFLGLFAVEYAKGKERKAPPCEPRIMIPKKP